MSTEISGHDSLEELRWVVESGDPQYLPARFLLGAASLDEGLLEQAERLLTHLIEGVERQNEIVRETIAARWIERKPRYLKLAKKLPFLRPWLDQWLRTVRHLYGGDFYRHAANWRHAQEIFDELREMPVNPTDRQQWQRDLKQHTLQTYLDTFAGDSLLFEKVRAALTPTTPSADADEARRWLDVVLDPDRIADLEHKLKMLEVRLVLREYAGTTPERIAEDVGEILAFQSRSVLFSRRLTELAEAWQARDWTLSGQTIARMLDSVRSPSAFEASREIEQARLPRVGRWFLKHLFPTLVDIETLQGRFRYPLYREARYLRSRCFLGTRDRKDLAKAHKEAEEMLDRVLDAPHKGPRRAQRQAEQRRRELRALTFCVRVESAVHLVVGEKEDDRDHLALDAQSFLLNRDSHERELRTYCGSKISEVVAAAYRARALLERHSSSRHAKQSDPELPQPPSREQEFLRRSLDVAPSASTWIYLAESQRDSREDARLSLSQALKLSPAHPYAKRLRTQLDG